MACGRGVWASVLAWARECAAACLLSASRAQRTHASERALALLKKGAAARSLAGRGNH